MNQNKSGKKSQLNFLDRFEGKRSTITKEGLNHLFEQHQNKLLAVPKSIDQKNINADISNKSLKKVNKNQIVRSESEVRGEASDNKTSRLSRRTQVLRRQPQDIDKIDKLILPKIINRFGSSYNRLNHNKNFNQQVRHQNLNNQMIQPRKIGYLMTKNLDQNAMQHLQFLSKLQQKLAVIRLKNQSN